LRHASVCARRSASDSSPDFSFVREASHCCASELMVVGIGTMRVTYAVPSASKVAESFCEAERHCASALRLTASVALAT